VRQTALPYETLDFEESLVPVEVRIGHQVIRGSAPAQ
jgi:hypothetical protein